MAGKGPYEINERINALLELDVKKMAYAPALGALNFDEVVPIAENIIALVQNVQNFDFKILPARRAQNLSNKIKEVHDLIHGMSTFSIERPDATQLRANLSSAIKDKSKELFEELVPVLATHAVLSDRVAEREKQFDEQIDRQLTKIDEAAQKADATLRAIECCGKGRYR
jgi:hypothetical protein